MRLPLARALYILGMFLFVGAVVAALVMGARAGSAESIPSWWWPLAAAVLGPVCLKTSQGLAPGDEHRAVAAWANGFIHRLRFHLRFVIVLALPVLGAGIVAFAPDVSPEARLLAAFGAALLMSWLMWEVRGVWQNWLRTLAWGTVLLLCAVGVWLRIWRA
jgi:hypothetical protein